MPTPLTRGYSKRFTYIYSGNPHHQPMRGAVLFPRKSPRGTWAGRRQTGLGGGGEQNADPGPQPAAGPPPHPLTRQASSDEGMHWKWCHHCGRSR